MADPTPANPPPSISLAERASNRVFLPAALTPLVGRERQVVAVADALRRPEVRLLTITGPGGVGKTRLSLAVARIVADGFTDGVAFVPLAPIRDTALIVPAIAQTIDARLPPDRDASVALKQHLRDDHRLLILDNFEHLTAGSTLVTDLLIACPGLTILVTSRVRLRLSGERCVALPPLALPPHPPDDGIGHPATIRGDPLQFPAIRLFVERARTIEPDFTLDDAHAATVVEICRRLDGLPLAIELAAARLRVLSPAALLARLSNRMTVLTDGPRDQPERLRTMRAAIAWSQDLLAPSERTLFRRLALFPSGCTLEAANAVGLDDAADGDVLDDLTALVDASLLERHASQQGAVRFGMLETIREFGLEQLAISGEAEATRRRFAAYFVAMVAQAEPALWGPQPQGWLARLQTEHANLRAALAWSIEREPATALRLAGGLMLFWEEGDRWTEGRDWLERALALAVDDERASAGALLAAGALAVDQGDFAQANARLDEAASRFRRFDDRLGLARTLERKGTIPLHQGDARDAAALLEEALALFQAVDDRSGIAAVLNKLGALAYNQGDYARADALLSEALAQFRALGDAGYSAMLSMNLGEVTARRGQFRRAAALVEEAMAAFRAEGGHWGIGLALLTLGEIALRQGDRTVAESRLREGIALLRDLHDRLGMARGLEILAEATAVADQSDVAARLYGAAQALREEIGAPQSVPERADRAPLLAALRARLGPTAFAAACDAGAVTPLDDLLGATTDGTQETLDAESPPPDVTPLTRREREVLRLLVAGRSDKEIAASLFVSRRTASQHVSAILAKLGVASRTAAVHAADRAGLV